MGWKKTYEMNVAAVKVAKAAAARFKDGKQRFVARPIRAGDEGSDAGAYRLRHAAGLVYRTGPRPDRWRRGLILIETMFDLNVAKVAATAAAWM